MQFGEYDIRSFLDQCVGLPLDEIIRRGHLQYYNVFAVAKPNTAADRYLQELKAFIAYLRLGVEPSTGEFRHYLPVVEALVKRGDLPASYLDAFHDSDAS